MSAAPRKSRQPKKSADAPSSVCRRCRPGQRARVIGRANDGAIVVVVRPHVDDEVISGCLWMPEKAPWVVTSLGLPLHCHTVWTATRDGTTPPLSKTPSQPLRTIVIDDSELVPIEDSDDYLGEELEVPVPVAKKCRRPRSVKA